MATMVKCLGVLSACSTWLKPAPLKVPGRFNDMYSINQGSVLLKAAYANGFLNTL